MKTLIFRNSTIENFFPKSTLIEFSDYDSVVFKRNYYKMYYWLYVVPISLNSEQLFQELQDYKNRVDLILSNIDENSTIYFFTLEPIYLQKFLLSDSKIENEIYEFNRYVRLLAKKRKNIKVIPFNEFLKSYSKKKLIDWRYYYLSKTIINPSLSKPFYKWFSKVQNALDQKRKKCIVLDLDNTLWGGVLGEDGINGIQLGATYPGNCYKDFQKSLLELKKLGIILTICSKNNIEDVRELWNKHDEMLLKESDFSAIRINWNNKAQNITELADELNIGLDSMVFIDDNPAERELVKKIIPEISVPEFPQKPYQLVNFFNEIYNDYFFTYNVTNEDIQKSHQYATQAKRNQFKSKFDNLDSYLTKLKIVLTIIGLNENNLSRMVQLTQKTNQFNLTTIRYTEHEFLTDKELYVIGLRVSDKFGDSGLTGLAIIRRMSVDECLIESFLLSCRILGKGIEDAFIKLVLKEIKVKGYKKVYAAYNKSKKNIQVKDFYKKNGFEITHVSEDRKEYLFDMRIFSEEKFKIKEYFKIIRSL
jgi:FkbH-like protein